MGGHTSKRNEALLTDVVRACKKNRDSVAKFWARIKCRGQDFDDDEVKGVVLDQEFVVPAFSLHFSGEPILPIAGWTHLEKNMAIQMLKYHDTNLFAPMSRAVGISDGSVAEHKLLKGRTSST